MRHLLQTLCWSSVISVGTAVCLGTLLQNFNIPPWFLSYRIRNLLSSSVIFFSPLFISLHKFIISFCTVCFFHIWVGFTGCCIKILILIPVLWTHCCLIIHKWTLLEWLFLVWYLTDALSTPMPNDIVAVITGTLPSIQSSCTWLRSDAYNQY